MAAKRIVYLAQHAIQHGVYGIDINPNESEVSRHVRSHIPGKAGVALPKLWEEVVKNLPQRRRGAKTRREKRAKGLEILAHSPCYSDIPHHSFVLSASSRLCGGIINTKGGWHVT